MNKRIASLALASMFAATPAVAADYGMAGCGLGSLVIKDDGVIQVLAATTNGTFYSQTFGITTGTSNCVSDGVVQVDKEQEAFAELNFNHLKTQMAQGEGEHLAAFVTLLGCDDDVRSDVYTKTQSSYDTVFPTSATTPQQALYSLKMQLSHDHDIVRSCSRI